MDQFWNLRIAWRSNEYDLVGQAIENLSKMNSVNINIA